MSNTPELQILCLRHGKTNYTGIFPDLTDEGVEHAHHVANTRVIQWIRENQIQLDELQIVSSPAARALGTAFIISGEIEHTLPVAIRDEIDAMIWKNGTDCLVALKGLSGKGYIDYETEPVFTDPKLFETPSEIRERWYAFLSKFIKGVVDKPIPQHAIFVSHYEVFCNIIRDLFGIIATAESALGHCEPIALSVSFTNDPTIVNLSGTFRGQTVHAIFDLSTCTIHQT